MKYPNPTFLQKAAGIKKKRHTRAIVISAVIAVMGLILAFISWGAHMQDIYRSEFPDMVGAGTSSSGASDETSTTASEETTTEETTTETSQTGLAPVVATTAEIPADNATDDTTAQDNTADPLTSFDPVTFRTSHPIQTISHEDRDVLLDSVKQQIIDYMSDNEDERISFRYVNLASNETLGLNDLTPVIPAGAWALPLNIVYCERVADGYISPITQQMFSGEEAPGNNSFIVDNYEPGKSFYLGTCAELSITHNDSLALSWLTDHLGGSDDVWSDIAPISSYVDYSRTITYTDYTGTVIRGSGRTCVYDLTSYMEYLYYGYINTPDTYLPLIGAMSISEMPTPYTTSFGTDATILHVCGRNEESNSYTDVAIIDGDEPLIIAISCECSSYDRACTIMADLSGYLQQYIASCHA